MAKLTKKQQKAYDWLKTHPGYLKTSRANALERYEVSTNTSIEPSAFESAWNLHKRSARATKVARAMIQSFTQTSNRAIITPVNDIDVSKVLLKHLEKPVCFTKFRHAPGTYYITGCCHAPWQNKAMYDSVLNYLSKEVELEGLILAGDVVDLNSLSSHDKGKIPIKGVTLDWEYREASKFLDQFDQLKINGEKDYIFGNHEDRYLRSMKDVDTAKLGNALMSPQSGLNLIGRGYNVYTNWKDDAIHLGRHLDICHGEFLNVHTAKKTIDTYRKSCLYFHTHRYQIFVEGLVGGFNMGFGGDIEAPIFGFATRAMKSSWVNASALVTLDKDGYYHVTPLVFMNNKLIVNGRSY